MPPEAVAKATIDAWRTDRDEVWIGKARFLPWLARLSPDWARAILDREPKTGR